MLVFSKIANFCKLQCKQELETLPEASVDCRCLCKCILL